MRMVQNADDNLESIEVHACDRDYDAADGAGECSPETAGDEIGAVTFAGRNFTEAERPAGLDPASPPPPLYATATARGLDDTTDLVPFEARTAARRVGNACVRTCRSRWSPSTSQKKTTK